MNDLAVPLSQAKIGQECLVVRFEEGLNQKDIDRLNAAGIDLDLPVTVLEHSDSGPIVQGMQGTPIAVGDLTAEKILVLEHKK